MTRHSKRMATQRDIRNKITQLETPELEYPAGDSFEAGQSLRNLINLAVRDGKKLNLIARRASLSTNTVSRLYYGETKYPRYDTIVKLFRYFNITLYGRRTNK